jgi:hypothetical protein
LALCVGDSPEGPLKNQGGSYLKPAKSTKRKHTSNLTQNVCTQHSPRRDGPRGPPERPNKMPPRARSASLEGSRPPRAKSASLEGSRSLERAPPHSRVPAFLERGPPRLWFPHERTCSRTRARAFNALTRQSRATTRLGITPRHCSADSLGQPIPATMGNCATRPVSAP